jgi:DNA-binding XRE family transcriptional regulator
MGELYLDTEKFTLYRKRLGKTQKQLAEILGVSIKAVHSYEQGWRKIPPHIERQIFFLLSNQRRRHKDIIPCWEKKQCTEKESCPAWEFQCGHLCWFLCGTCCDCTQGFTAEQKREKCLSCDILKSLIE